LADSLAESSFVVLAYPKKVFWGKITIIFYKMQLSVYSYFNSVYKYCRRTSKTHILFNCRERVVLLKVFLTGNAHLYLQNVHIKYRYT
jgi:hypothetical protein